MKPKIKAVFANDGTYQLYFEGYFIDSPRLPKQFKWVTIKVGLQLLHLCGKVTGLPRLSRFRTNLPITQHKYGRTDN